MQPVGDISTTRRALCLGLAGFLLAVAVPAPGPAWAQSLNDLRAQGVVGEGYDGLARVRTPAPGAQAAVDKINAERRAIYSERAKQQGVPPDQVGRVYAQQIFRNAPAGTWLLQENGQWTRK
jgi:uncharacterized protein YdbL (DUF1318 family)